MNGDDRDIKREQFRQAKKIHGGLMGMFGAAMVVKLSRMPIPTRRLRLSVYRGAFGKKYPPGLNEGEAARPLWEYPSFNALFTRGVKPECRPIPSGTRQFLSPCDGTVQEIGRVERGRIVTLKGIEYTISSLLPGVETSELDGANFAIVFLSPIDCHRVFSPQDAKLEEVIHVPGHRLLVHPPFQRAEYPVYTLNERMIFRLSTELGSCVLVMVAGWGVGNITMPLAPDFRPRSTEIEARKFSPAAQLRRGDWMATFELGSTVVLFAPPTAGAVPVVCSHAKVKYGQPLFTYGG